MVANRLQGLSVKSMFMKHKKQSFKRATTALCLALLPTAAAWATGAPDAGAIQQQMDRSVKQPAAPVVPAAKAAPAQAVQPGQAVLTVSQFEFVGNTLLSADVLTELTRGFLNKPLSLAELRSVSEQVQQAYSAAGWMVHVYLPAQEIDGGKVKVQVVAPVEKPRALKILAELEDGHDVTFWHAEGRVWA